MVDHDLVERKLVLLKERKALLKSYKLRTFAHFQDGPYQKAVEKTLQEMIEICLDIGKHIIADEGLPIANDSKEVFDILCAHRIISKAMRQTMHEMVGFRNFIVHMYERINPSIVYTVYTQHLKDFDRFSLAIVKFLR